MKGFFFILDFWVIWRAFIDMIWMISFFEKTNWFWK